MQIEFIMTDEEAAAFAADASKPKPKIEAKTCPPRRSQAMSLPSIQFDKKLTTVFTDKLTLWFSYGDLVAFRVGAEKFVCENCWGTTTGRHLNQIDGGNKDLRLSKDKFQQAWWQFGPG